MSNEQVKKSVLPNGVRVLTETMPQVGSAAVGVWCLTGSIHETAGEAGITHFIEHMLFKGTGKRNAQQIAEEIEGRGGMLNAFTDKERTCYYCKVLAEDTSVGLDVLTDMLTGSLLDPEELAREKGVVLEEIKRSEDEPGDHVHDLHMEGLWPDHKLGLPVIGTKESVSSFKRDNLATYMDRRYRANNLIVAVAGNVDHASVVEAAESTLGKVATGGDSEQLDRPQAAAGRMEKQREVEQVHFCLGTEGRSYHDPDYFTLVVMDGILGGGMSGRLFQEVREKRGLAYAIGSYMASYGSGGAFTVYGGTGAQTWQEVQDVVLAEFDKLVKNGPTEAETAKVKKQIAGNMVLGLESTNARMMRMAKNEIVYGRHVPVSETMAKINAVTCEDVQTLAEQLFDPAKLRVTAIVPGQ